MKRNAGRPGIVVTTGGKGVAAHAGARLLCELADELGLRQGLSEAMAPTKKRRRGHDRGQVLVDLAVAIADGATAISDLRVLADQAGPLRRRGLGADDLADPRGHRRRRPERIASARAKARAKAWAAGLDPGFYVIDLDATLVGAHSEKEGAAPNYKHGFGFHRSWPSSMPPVSPWPHACGPATPRRGTPRITSSCSTTPWPSCRSIPTDAR